MIKISNDTIWHEICYLGIWFIPAQLHTLFLNRANSEPTDNVSISELCKETHTNCTQPEISAQNK